MKKLIITVAIIASIAILMFAEYRFIMCNLKPYYADGYTYIEFMGQTDMYYAE